MANKKTNRESPYLHWRHPLTTVYDSDRPLNFIVAASAADDDVELSRVQLCVVASERVVNWKKRELQQQQQQQ